MNDKSDLARDNKTNVSMKTESIITVIDILDYYRKAVQAENATKIEKENLNYWENVKILLENRKAFPKILEREFAEKAKEENRIFNEILEILQSAEAKITALLIENSSIIDDPISYYDII